MAPSKYKVWGGHKIGNSHCSPETRSFRGTEGRYASLNILEYVSDISVQFIRRLNSASSRVSVPPLIRVRTRKISVREYRLDIEFVHQNIHLRIRRAFLEAIGSIEHLWQKLDVSRSDQKSLRET